MLIAATRIREIDVIRPGSLGSCTNDTCARPGTYRLVFEDGGTEVHCREHALDASPTSSRSL